MNVIFLDIEGVLDGYELQKKNHKIFLKTHEYKFPLDQKKLKLLKKIVEDYNLNIVLSSTKRLSFDNKMNPINESGKSIKEQFTQQGLSLYSKTKNLGETRGLEIEEWLKRNTIRHFVILDDETDMGKYTTHLVKTKTKVGLTKKHLKQIEKIINKSID